MLHASADAVLREDLPNVVPSKQSECREKSTTLAVAAFQIGRMRHFGAQSCDGQCVVTADMLRLTLMHYLGG